MFVLPLRHIIAVGESPVKIMLSRDYYEMRALALFKGDAMMT